MEVVYSFIVICLINSVLGDETRNRHWRGRMYTAWDAPYVAVVLITKTNEGCIGNIIDERWILSAAHCLFKDRLHLYDKEDVKVAYGTNNIKKIDNYSKVSSIIVHPHYVDYKPYVVEHDIALLELEQPIELDETARIIELDGSEWEKKKMERLCSIVGFNGYSLQGTEFVLKKGRGACKCGPTYGGYICGKQSNFTNRRCNAGTETSVICKDKLTAIASKSNKCTFVYDPDCAYSNETVFINICYHLRWINRRIPENRRVQCLEPGALTYTKTGDLSSKYIATERTARSSVNKIHNTFLLYLSIFTYFQ